MISEPPINEMLDLLEQTFKNVRPLILESAGKAGLANKQDGSPVTNTDVLIEKTVMTAMLAQFPDIPVFGEESGYSDVLPNICWLVDPIDGTESLINNLPYFTCMAVLIIDNEAAACIIYNPTNDDTFIAKKGQGAYKNGVRISLKDTPLPQKAYCKGRHIAVLNKVLENTDVSCALAPSGAGFGFAAIVDGISAARFQLHSRGYPHDYAPGALLVSEAGGVIITLSKDAHPYTLKSFIACHPDLEPVLSKNIQIISDLEL